MPGCFVQLILVQVGSYYNWYNISSSDDFQLFGHINMSITALGFSAMNNVIILVGLNIFTLFKTVRKIFFYHWKYFSFLNFKSQIILGVSFL